MASINPAARIQMPAARTPATQAQSAQPTSAQSGQSLPMTALRSPYDGTTPNMLGGSPILGPSSFNPSAYGSAPQLTGLGAGAGHPQTNATNQTAIAPNGNVNQVVTNDNQYTNKYYNIIMPNSGLLGGFGGVGGLFGASGRQGSSFVDPATGVLYVQRDTGISGWFRRLLGGG